MGNNTFGLIGASSQALEILDFAPQGSVKFFLSNQTSEIGASFLDVPVLDLETSDSAVTQIPVFPALGAPGLKRKLLPLWKGELSNALLADSAYVSKTAIVGLGSIVAPNAVLMTNVQIGRSVLINVGATISHDTVIGDFSTVSPGVHIGGNCNIQDGVFLGIGATVIQGVQIASGSYIAAGAVVTKDITKPGTYLGIPAAYANDNKIWATSI